MNDLFTITIVIGAAVLIANIGLLFINVHMYKVCFRLLRRKLSKPSIKVTIPTGTIVYVEIMELEDSLPVYKNKKGLVNWSAGNELNIKDEDGVIYYTSIDKVIHAFDK